MNKQPVTDVINGILHHSLLTKQSYLLSSPVGSRNLIPFYDGQMNLVYAFPLLHEKDLFVPTWVYDDFQREYVGKDALNFLLKRGDSFPRADVGGLQVSTSGGREIFLRELDVSAGLVALVRPIQASIGVPFVRLSDVIWVDDAAVDIRPADPPSGDLSPFFTQSVRCWQGPQSLIPGFLENEKSRL